MGKIDTTFFIKSKNNDIFIVQIYVDDIIFGTTNVSLCEEFAKSMHYEFEMSIMGELNFFLDLQIKQLKEGTFINQAKYVRDFLNKIHSLSYLMTSRPDIMYSVCLCARFQACSQESHLNVVKIIFRYLKGTIDIDGIQNVIILN